MVCVWFSSAARLGILTHSAEGITRFDAGASGGVVAGIAVLDEPRGSVQLRTELMVDGGARAAPDYFGGLNFTDGEKSQRCFGR